MPFSDCFCLCHMFFSISPYNCSCLKTFQNMLNPIHYRHYSKTNLLMSGRHANEYSKYRIEPKLEMCLDTCRSTSPISEQTDKSKSTSLVFEFSRNLVHNISNHIVHDTAIGVKQSQFNLISLLDINKSSVVIETSWSKRLSTEICWEQRKSFKAEISIEVS